MVAYRRSHLKFVVASLIAGLAIVTLPGAAVSSTPTLIWTGAKRVNIMCNVAGGPGIDHVALTKQLCRDVSRLAVKGATIPVRAIAIGDPAVLASDEVTLLVHASVTRSGEDRLLAFTVRPFRASTETTAVLFGAAPRAASIAMLGATSPALDAAITAALSETLPWPVRPAHLQPIH